MMKVTQDTSAKSTYHGGVRFILGSESTLQFFGQRIEI